ncbi:hypothetical protein EDC19_0512 [Natranaerovirga hydrolytica]|uniref:Zinc ribbon protein n=1 Tax=Natranaerovirga hydrolytica TaxID=680378 RepID=A0A4R1MY90_9FIRM|nr:zinc ribbon domain-containing protein [Natranaerovirga hydrolytica]TCK98095.1 hypothetical protein EDC19_0512 [Natranaerovirga hydrolytica]
MFCKNCGKAVKKDGKFCNHCGTKVEGKIQKHNEESSNTLEGYTFNQETLWMALKITSVSLGVTFFLSTLVSLIYFWIQKSNAFMSRSYEVFDIVNVMNHSLFNKLTMNGDGQVIRFLVLLLIPILAIFIGYKIFYRKSELILDGILALCNGLFFSIINLIITLIIRSENMTYASFYTFFNTFFIVAVISFVLSKLKNNEFSLNNTVLKNIKIILTPIALITVVFTTINIIYFIVFTREILSITYVVSIALLIPNILLYSFLFLMGIPMTMGDALFDIFGIRMGVSLYREFTFINIVLMIVILLITIHSMYKIYKNNKEDFVEKMSKTILAMGIMNMFIAIYSRQRYSFSDITFYTGINPFAALFITVLFFGTMALLVYYLNNKKFILSIHSIFTDFKITIFIAIGLLIIINHIFSFNAVKNDDLLEVIYYNSYSVVDVFHYSFGFGYNALYNILNQLF